MHDSALEERLNSLTDRSEGERGCWPWKGRTNHYGYGQLYWKGETQTVSRLVLANKLGRAIKPRYQACHACDNPRCVNPAHLFEGTQGDNNADMVRKGRANFFGYGSASTITRRSGPDGGRRSDFHVPDHRRADDWADINEFALDELGVNFQDGA